MFTSLANLLQSLGFAVWLGWGEAYTIPTLLNNFFFYKRLNTDQKRECVVRVMSTCFACLIVPLSLDSLYVLPSSGQLAPIVNTTTTFALGYFLWDLHLCYKHYATYGAAFLLHAVFCTTSYYIVAVEQQMVVFGLSALLYESSTPFLNARWFLLRMNYKRDDVVWQRVNQAFVVVFLLVRMGFGSYLTYSTVQYCFNSTNESKFIRLFSFFNVVLSFMLNCFWTNTIVQNVIMHFVST